MSLLNRIVLVMSVALLTIPLASATLLISIDDESESPVMTSNDTVVDQGEVMNDSFIAIEGVFTQVNVRFIVVEPSTTNVVSDIIGLQVSADPTHPGTTDIFLGFQSDAESPLTYVPNPGLDEIITETGAFQTIYSDKLSADLSLNIQFASDAPEPATLALLGIGVAGIGFARRRAKLI